MKYTTYAFLFFFFLGLAGNSPHPIWKLALIAAAFTAILFVVTFLLKKFKFI